MVRRAKGTSKPNDAIEQPGDRMDGRHLQCFLLAERGEDRGQPSREHRLACARRADEKDIVRSRGGNLEDAFARRLPDDFRKIGRFVARGIGGTRLWRWESAFPKPRHKLGDRGRRATWPR